MRKVKLHYLFSKNKKIGSRLIAWGTKHRYPELKDIPSHVAILIDEKWVFESTLESGVRVIGYKKWLEINTQVEKIPCTQDRTYEEVKDMFKSIKDLKYDWMGVLYLGLNLVPNKLFGRKLPENNPWASDSKYFCCEVMSKLTGIDYEMSSPVDVMVEIKKSVT